MQIGVHRFHHPGHDDIEPVGEAKFIQLWENEDGAWKLNPISPNLILLSGAGPSFGLNGGLLFLPGIVAANAGTRTRVTLPLPFSFFWLALALLVSAIFIAVLGPGIKFS